MGIHIAAHNRRTGGCWRPMRGCNSHPPRRQCWYVPHLNLFCSPMFLTRSHPSNLLHKGPTKKEAFTNGWRANSRNATGSWNCKPLKGRIQMSLTYRYFLPWVKDTQNYSKFTIIQSEADTDRIWAIALAIWNGLTSAMIARAFLFAYRIMGKIVET